MAIMLRGRRVPSGRRKLLARITQPAGLG